MDGGMVMQKNTFNRLIFTNEMQVEAMLLLCRNNGWTKIYLLTGQDSSNQSLSTTLVNKAPMYGIEVVDNIYFNEGNIDIKGKEITDKLSLQKSRVV